MAKKKSENKDLLELGQRSRAGRLLSEYIRAIGTETDQVVQDEVPQGCTPGMPRMVSKAEALARHIWRNALPRTDDDGTRHEPDIRYIHIVLERAEGKAGTVEQEKTDTRESVPDKISRINAERINRISSEVTGDDQ
ncbi:MAG: hypothetical protein ABFE01_16760 [Phycisphaerales bacterium]